MTMYCTCNTCKGLPCRPHGVQMGKEGMEQVDGSFVMMEPGSTLIHFSDSIFLNLYSTEIHHFAHLGAKPMVGASFYLFEGGVPHRLPKTFQTQGFGGHYRYTIDWDFGNQVNAFYKLFAANPTENHSNYREVTVALGCGGSIRFDVARNGDRKGVSYYYTGIPPSTK